MDREIIPEGFDYSSLPPEAGGAVRAATKRIRALERQTSEAIIEIGRELLAVKAALPHGQFGRWLTTEFSWSDRTARRFMQVAERFGHLESGHIGRFAPTALYALASDTVPDAIRVKVMEQAERGEPVPNIVVQPQITDAIPPQTIRVTQPRDASTTTEAAWREKEPVAEVMPAAEEMHPPAPPPMTPPPIRMPPAIAEPPALLPDTPDEWPPATPAECQSVIATIAPLMEAFPFRRVIANLRDDETAPEVDSEEIAAYVVDTFDPGAVRQFGVTARDLARWFSSIATSVEGRERNGGRQPKP